MTSLPLARISNAIAIQDENRLILRLDGVTDGFGGRFAVYHPQWKVFPPVFIVYELPGTCGINPAACPQDVATQGAFVFPGSFPKIQVHSASGQQILSVEHTVPGTIGQPISGEEKGRLLDVLPSLPVHLGEGGERDPPRAVGVDREVPLPFALEIASNWYAWHNRMPGSEATLHLVGIQMMPTPGYTYTIGEAQPQGWNPNQLVLELELKEPAGVQPAVITPMTVSWSKETNDRVEAILLRIGDQVVVVPVFEIV